MTKTIGQGLDGAREEASAERTRQRPAAGLKRALRSGASVLALVVGGLGAMPATAFADPSITYTGSVSPAPDAGTTGWAPTGDIIIGDTADGSLTLSGGATLKTDDIDGDTGAIYVGGTGGNGTLTLDGAGTNVDVNTILSKGGVFVGFKGTDGTLNITNGASLNAHTIRGVQLGASYTDGQGNRLFGRGVLNLSGPGSQLVIDNGNTGGVLTARYGDVTISSGASLVAPAIFLGGISPGYGSGSSMLLTGANTTASVNSITVQPGIDMSSGVGGVVSSLTIQDGATLKDASNGRGIGITLPYGGIINFGSAPGQAAVASGEVDGSVRIMFGGPTGNTGDLPAGAVNFNHTGTLRLSGSFGTNSPLGQPEINQIAGTTILTDIASQSGFPFAGSVNISGGVLQLGDAANGGKPAVLGTALIHNNATLAIDSADAVALANVIDGTGRLVKSGAGTLTLSGANTYSGGTQINTGAIAVSGDNALGAASGAVTFDGGTLQATRTFTSTRGFVFNNGGGTIQADTDAGFSGALTGTGSFTKTGAGDLTLSGNGANFTGTTTVNAGTLSIDGTFGTGDITVASGATLAGNGGTIGGNVTVQSGATLSHEMGNTQTFNQNLTVAAGGKVDVSLGSDELPLFYVKGNLDASGTLTVNDDGGFGAGEYTVFRVDGTINNTMTLTAGNGVTQGDISFVNNAHTIGIQNTDGMQVAYWDGSNTTGDGTIHGGQGNWGGATTNWTGKDGNNNIQWATGDFAIFKNTAGPVTVDAGGISVGGMQFLTNGYKVSGGTITLLNDTKAPIIRVGDGTSAGTGTTATIDAVLAGANGMKKTDYGTLVLTGNNTYTGQTEVLGGKLQLGNGTSSGQIAGNVTVNTGSTLEFNHDNTAEYIFGHAIDGAGKVVVSGTGTATDHAITHLNGANTFTGGLEVKANAEARAGSASAFGAGILTVDAGGYALLNGQDVVTGGLQGAGSVDLGNNSLTLSQTDDTEFSGRLVQSGGQNGTLVKNGTGSLTLTGNDSDGIVQVSGGTLRIGADDGMGSNVGTSGDVKNNIIVDTSGTLAFNRSDAYTYSHTISGAGSVVQAGRGTTILTQNNDNTGTTTISRGTLQLGDGTSGTGTVGGNVVNNATLAFNHKDSFTFGHEISGDGVVVVDGTGPTTLSGNNSFTGGVEVKTGATLRAGIKDVAFGQGLLTVDGGGKADISGFDTTLTGLAGAGAVELGAQTLTLTGQGDTFSGALSGTGGLTLDGGQQTFAGQNSTYSGATELKNGALLSVGANNSLSAASAYDVDKTSTLDLGGFNATVGALANAGTVSINGSTPGATLTVAGDYSGDNGTVVINSVLGGDNAATDKLQVNGNTSGSTTLQVANRGGAGAQTVNGIEVVNVGGQSDGSFVLKGDYVTKDGKQAVVAGAYAYTLEKGNQANPKGGNWYLTNSITKPVDPTNPTDPTDPTNPTNPTDPTNPTNPTKPVDPTNPGKTRYGAGVPVYEGYAANLQALNKLPTLQERVGERYWTGKNGDGQTDGAMVNDVGVWARIEGAHNRLEPQTVTGGKQDINTFIMQAGVDGQFYEGENGRLIAGITGQYGHAKGDISSFSGDGDISTDAWSLGATTTWYGNNGFYVDGQAQVTWFDSDLNSDTANTGLADGRKATGYALSMEAGQRIAIDQNWSLTPQAQLMYSSVDANAFRDTWGSRVSLHDGDSLIGRFGLAANYASNWKGTDGLMVNTSVYGIANLYQEMLGGTTVNVAGVDFDTDNDKTWAGIGAGGTYAWADNKYAVYGEGSINTGLNHFTDSYALKGTVGFKVKW